MEMPSTFFTAERLEQFWFYVKWFMKFNMPIFMICMAVLVTALVVDMIIDTMNAAQKDNDDDDYDVNYY